jgi:hypothetical protein
MSPAGTMRTRTTKACNRHLKLARHAWASDTVAAECILLVYHGMPAAARNQPGASSGRLDFSVRKQSNNTASGQTYSPTINILKNVFCAVSYATSNTAQGPGIQNVCHERGWSKCVETHCSGMNGIITIIWHGPAIVTW